MPDPLEELIRQRGLVNKTMGAYAPPAPPPQAPPAQAGMANPNDPDDRVGLYKAMMQSGLQFPGRTTDIELPADGGQAPPQKDLRRNALLRLMDRAMGKGTP